MVFFTSSDEGRYGQWENVSWWDFIKAEGKSEEYKRVLARGLTRTVVAAKERKASTRTIGNMAEAFIANFEGRGNDGAPDRVLNAPTNEAWIDPWVRLLRRPLNIVRGHMTFVDAPWALTALTQGQFWAGRRFTRDYGDGHVVDCLSVDISDWDTPGIVYRRPAKRCSRQQVAHEVLEQIKAHLNDNGKPVLTDDMIHSWHLDPAIAWHPARRRNSNDEPLLVNTVGSWRKRPKARTRIPNLFLSGDYVKTNIDLATMEGANESGRAAVNALLDASGSKAPPVRMYKLYDPPEFEPSKQADLALYRAGQPNALDH